MHTHKDRKHPACLAGLITATWTATAAVLPLATPPPGDHADTESATNVSLLAWRDYEPRAALTRALNATPSNAVQVAFGYDRDHNADLAPEETELVFGCDCGVWFTRDERTNHQLPTTISPDSGSHRRSAGRDCGSIC